MENDLASLFKKRKNELKEDEKEPSINKIIVDDGTIDFDIKKEDGLKFLVGKEVSKYFPVMKPEEIDVYASNTEELYKLRIAYTLYNKSLKDQIKQKGLNIELDIEKESELFEKLLDIKRLGFLIDVVGLNDDLKDKILDRELDKKFAKLDNKKKDSSVEKELEKLNNTISSMRHYISKKESNG
jgi:hypothetical protein